MRKRLGRAASGRRLPAQAVEWQRVEPAQARQQEATREPMASPVPQPPKRKLGRRPARAQRVPKSWEMRQVAAWLQRPQLVQAQGPQAPVGTRAAPVVPQEWLPQSSPPVLEALVPAQERAAVAGGPEQTLRGQVRKRMLFPPVRRASKTLAAPPARISPGAGAAVIQSRCGSISCRSGRRRRRRFRW
ncbi:MAG: hypothetical protein N2689_01490 [Verrucomicrobiae bacterium]|nr:hypothetical protein [Verrucomicrobiae bacterium]